MVASLKEIGREMRKQTFETKTGRTFRFKKRSNDMVQSWIESLPSRREDSVVLKSLPWSSHDAPSEGTTTKSKTSEYTSLSVTIPQTCTNISKGDDIIELEAEEASYLANQFDGPAVGAAKASQAPAPSPPTGGWWQTKLDAVYFAVRTKVLSTLPSSDPGAEKEDKAGRRPKGLAGCYSIRTKSMNSERSPASSFHSAASAVDEENPKVAGAGAGAEEGAGAGAGAVMKKDCRPSIERADKTAFHANVPSSILTLTICAFQFTHSSGLLLSFYLFKL